MLRLFFLRHPIGGDLLFAAAKKNQQQDRQDWKHNGGAHDSDSGTAANPQRKHPAHKLPQRAGADVPAFGIYRGLRLPSRGANSRFRMPLPSSATDDVIHSESFLRLLMRRQLRLSISCAATFLIALLGMPLLNYFAPAMMATRVAGFTLSWLVLGVLFFPFVWVISWIFIRRSMALEEDEVVQAGPRPEDPR